MPWRTRAGDVRYHRCRAGAYAPDRPRYLCRHALTIIECVAGVDFDCVMPSRNARHGKLFTWRGTLNIKNAGYIGDSSPIDPGCSCPVCSRYSRAYISHLIRAGEILGLRLCVMHNLFFYNELMAAIRAAIELDEFDRFRREYSQLLEQRI